jgi:hypothetical protein
VTLQFEIFRLRDEHVENVREANIKTAFILRFDQDEVVAWGVFPVLSSSGDLISGKFRLCTVT